uniref:DUF1618 domain-containing protein n=1 Tax=Oryza punctata TaxID=4537 RepID=A0A0E0JGB3_ORYPU
MGIHEREYDGKPVNAGIWRLNCQALVKDIWNDEGYKATKLPREIPTVAFNHPELPGDVAYFLIRSRLFGVNLNTRKVLEWKFFAMLNPPMRYHRIPLHSRIFAVDVRARRLLECRFFEMFHPPMRYHSSQFVRAWKLPTMVLADTEIETETI